MGNICCAIKVSGCVPWAGDTVVLPKLRLVRSCRAADAAVGAGVIIVSRSTVYCGGRGGVTYATEL